MTKEFKQCDIANGVSNLLQNLTINQMREHKKSLQPMMMIFQMATPADESAQREQEKIMFMDRCLTLAIAYIEDQTNQSTNN